VPLEDQVGALKELEQTGKVRHIGLSEVSVDQLRAAQRVTTVATVQDLYNLGNRDPRHQERGAPGGQHGGRLLRLDEEDYAALEDALG
jgi:aryl-alcohol dehydrogenase-like predicted oxidoreductase